MNDYVLYVLILLIFYLGISIAFYKRIFSNLHKNTIRLLVFTFILSFINSQILNPFDFSSALEQLKDINKRFSEADELEVLLHSLFFPITLIYLICFFVDRNKINKINGVVAVILLIWCLPQSLSVVADLTFGKMCFFLLVMIFIVIKLMKNIYRESELRGGPEAEIETLSEYQNLLKDNLENEDEMISDSQIENDELQKLIKLKEDGHISNAIFEVMKKRLK